MEQHNRLRTTFDQVALLYDRARPGYPREMFDDVVALSGMPRDGRILEIGCGTGQATLPLAERGYRIACIELGAHLADVARRKLESYPQVEIWTGAFETWPLAAESFDLAISATAFHWIDPAIRLHKTAQALKPGGAIALWWNHHVHTDAEPAFFDAVQHIYERVAPEIADKDFKMPRAEELATPVKDEIERTDLFGPVTIRTYRWDQAYDSRSYIDVLNTYSNHRNLSDRTRQRLLDSIAELIDSEYGGRIVKGYATILYLAQRR